MYCDINTNNKSFIKGMKELKNKDIKNNKFMLEVKNDEIRYIDIQKTIELENGGENQLILNECIDNIWFFFRELVTVNNIPKEYRKGFINLQDTEIPFILSWETMRILYYYSKGYDIIIDEYKYNKEEFSRIIDCINWIKIYEMIKKCKTKNITISLFNEDYVYSLDHVNSLISIYSESNIYKIIPIMDLIVGNINIDFLENESKLQLKTSKCKNIDDRIFIDIIRKYNDNDLFSELYKLKKLDSQIVIINYKNEENAQFNVDHDECNDVTDVVKALLFHKADIKDYDNTDIIKKDQYIYI